MTISQAKKLELITKHAKKFAYKGEARPILEGIHYAADGSVCVTDSHKLLRIKDAHSFAEPFVSHARTGAPIDGNYPDVSKVIPTEFKSQIIVSDVKKILDIVKICVDISKVAGEKTFLTKLKYVGATVELSVSSRIPEMNFTAGVAAEVSGPDVEISFNASYLHDALNVFKDAGSERVVIGLSGSVSPMTIVDEVSEITTVVLPYRNPA